MKRNIQILYDESLFDNYANADKISEDLLIVTRRRGDLEVVNDVIQWYC